MIKNNDKSILLIKDISPNIAIFYIVTHLKTALETLRYMRIVIFDFFLLQFTVKWGWRKIEIIDVDNELDAEVPFVPSLVGIYLDFVFFWVRPLSVLIVKDKKRALKYVSEFLHLVADIYHQASTFYKYKMTTTKRPTAKDYRDKHFDAIRRFDPHYLCVPSLHIAVVVLTYAYFRKAFDEMGFSDDEKNRYNEELFKGAIEIGETVLYIKQHSVNCIPAALYMMTDAISTMFSITDAVLFMDTLFKDQTNITPKAKKDIKAHLHHLFEQLLLEGKYSDYWLEPLKRWLKKYKNGEYNT